MSNQELMGTVTVRTKDGSIKEVTDKFENNHERANEWCQSAIRTGIAVGDNEEKVFYPPHAVLEASYGPILPAKVAAPAKPATKKKTRKK